MLDLHAAGGRRGEGGTRGAAVDARPRVVRFRVVGVAQPKGSTRAFAFKRPNGTLGTRTTSDNPKLKGWQALVAARAQLLNVARFEGAVRLVVVFYLPRSKSLRKRIVEHVTRPDCDKLLRGVGDALTGVLWRDDAQVVEVFARKQYATADQPIGVSVQVTG